MNKLSAVWPCATAVIGMRSTQHTSSNCKVISICAIAINNAPFNTVSCRYAYCMWMPLSSIIKCYSNFNGMSFCRNNLWENWNNHSHGSHPCGELSATVSIMILPYQSFKSYWEGTKSLSVGLWTENITKYYTRNWSSQTYSSQVISFFGKVRAWNQSTKAISLHRPPAVLTLIYDNHDVPNRHRELIVPLNKDRNNQQVSLKNEQKLEHLNVSHVEVRHPCQEADLCHIVINGRVLLTALLGLHNSRNGSVYSFWCFCWGVWQDCSTSLVSDLPLSSQTSD